MNCWRDGDEGEDVGRPAQIAGYVEFVQRTPPSTLREQQSIREMVSNSGAQHGGRESISSSCWAVSPSELRRDVRINGNIGRFNISAKDTVRGKKTAIQKILSVDNRFILQKVYEKRLITERDYNNLKNLNKEDPEGHVIELVDNIMNKGEDICKHFLKLLQYDNDITTTFPQLKNLQLNYTHFLPKPGQVSPPQRGVLLQDGASQREVRSYSGKGRSAQHNSPDENSVEIDKYQDYFDQFYCDQDSFIVTRKPRRKKTKLRKILSYSFVSVVITGCFFYLLTLTLTYRTADVSYRVDVSNKESGRTRSPQIREADP